MEHSRFLTKDYLQILLWLKALYTPFTASNNFYFIVWCSEYSRNIMLKESKNLLPPVTFVQGIRTYGYKNNIFISFVPKISQEKSRKIEKLCGVGKQTFLLFIFSLVLNSEIFYSSWNSKHFFTSQITEGNLNKSLST